MYESDDIVAYLERQYAATAAPEGAASATA